MSVRLLSNRAVTENNNGIRYIAMQGTYQCYLVLVTTALYSFFFLLSFAICLLLQHPATEILFDEAVGRVIFAGGNVIVI